MTPPTIPTPAEYVAQTAALQQAIADSTAAGWRLESTYTGMAQMASGTPFNHVLHALISIFTLGLWLPVWLLAAVTHPGEKRMMIYADGQGNITYVPSR